MISLKINNMPVYAQEGSTVLEAARSIGIKIPTLCHLKGISELGACRVCVVEVKGMNSLVAACEYPVREGMEVFTNTPRVLNSRKTTIELILSDHRKDCLSCERNTNCELQRLSHKYGCDSHRFEGNTRDFVYDDSTDYLIRDNSKCILCRRCVAVCRRQQGVGVIGANDRGFATHIACPFDMKLADTPCVGCGQCINVCPTGALQEKEEITRVQEALANPNKHVVVGYAPSVRAALAEAFDLPLGVNCQGKINTALRYLGFDKVFDVNCSADFTIAEEADELVRRLQDGGKLPMFTSCCPGWVNHVQKNYPELLPNLSSCKSPQQMFGALVKHIYSKIANIDPSRIFVVTVMPCTAKKGEKRRTFTDNLADVDAVITTRELASLCKENGILLNELPDSETDKPFGEYSGAGMIFGATGGVMEAALRTAVTVLDSNARFAPLEFREVRGLQGVKEASYVVNGRELKVAVVNGLLNVNKVCQAVKNGECDYQFIEVMTCPGGCVMGGGQPIRATIVRHKAEIAAARAEVLYSADRTTVVRRSHNNSGLQKIYADYIGSPNGETAHKLLHTSYRALPKYCK